MSKKQIIQYIACLAVCFLLGCGIALGLRAYDSKQEIIMPISGGQTIDFSEYGFTLTVPDGYSLNDYTANNLNEGGNARFAGCAYMGDSELYIFCYANAAGDDVSAYGEQELISYYMSAGATQVRLRELGGRRFICYRATVDTSEGTQLWDTYETWDSEDQITFETQMAPENVLPILATMTFTK